MRLMKIILPVFILFLFACDNGGKTIASVGSKSIKEQDFNAFLKFKRIPAQDKQRVDRVLEDYLQREAISQEAVDSEFIDPDLLKAEIEEFKKEMLIGRYFENFLKDKVNDEAVRNFYNSNQDQFNVEKVRVSHILVRTNKSMSDNERQALLTKAREAYSKVTSGTAFEEVVKSYSEDKVSAKKGGDIGWIKKGAIDPVFSEKVFNMNKGDVTEPFATTFGFHIVKLMDGPQVIKTPFEKVKGNIRYQLRQQAKQAEIDRILKSVTIKRKS